MFVCSVGTLLINGNPLLRYDGYYVFADWLETPNLQQQATAAIRRSMAWLFAGVTLDQPRLIAEPGPILLWSYAIASMIYRGVVIVGILWFLDAALRPMGLGTISFLIATIILASVVAGPIAQAAASLHNPHSRRQIDQRRLVASLLVVAGLIAVLTVIPLPAHISSPAITRPSGGRQVFVTTGGVLVSARQPGEQVTVGEPVAQLANKQLELEVAELASRESLQRLHVTHLSLRQHRRPELADQLPAAEQRLADLAEQLAQKRLELARLTLVAPINGTLLPPPAQVAPASDESLTAFAGTPQQPQNRGCFLDAGTLLCTIADPRRLEAVAIVEQSELPGLREGQTVRLALNQLPGTLLRGTVQEISRLQSDELPPQIIAERMIPLRSGPQGRAEPVHTYYQATIALHSNDYPLLVGGAGWAKITVDSQPLWLRAYRGLRGTMRTPW